MTDDPGENERVCSEGACSFVNQSARAEARSLLPLLLAGSTVEELCELISVSPKIERVLLAYVQAHAEDAHFIEENLKFRQAVGREFERLVREAVPVPEDPENSDLDVSEEAITGCV